MSGELRMENPTTFFETEQILTNKKMAGCGTFYSKVHNVLFIDGGP